MNKEELESVAWIIKHRPKSLKEVVGREAKEIAKLLERGDTPHFLFYSRTPGTGKTTVAKAIINDYKTDFLEINSSMDRSIENIRTTVKQFVATKNVISGRKKIVFLDEADGLLKPVQDSLRNLMETYASNAIFILTCNYIEKIIEPLKNRCMVFEFGTPEKNDIKDYLIKICEKETLEYSEEGLFKLIDIYYPSIRNMVNELQRLKVSGKKALPEFIKKDDEIFEELYNLLKNKKVFEARKIFLEKGFNPEDLLRFFWKKSYTDKTLSGKQIYKLTTNLAEVDYRMSVGADKKLQLDYLLFQVTFAIARD